MHSESLYTLLRQESRLQTVYREVKAYQATNRQTRSSQRVKLRLRTMTGYPVSLHAISNMVTHLQPTLLHVHVQADLARIQDRKAQAQKHQ